MGQGGQRGLKEGPTEAPTPGARADGERGRRGGGVVQPGGVGWGARSCPASARTWALGPEDRSGLAQAPPRGAGKIRDHILFHHFQPVCLLEWPRPAWERMGPLEQLPPNTWGTRAAGSPPTGPGPALSALPPLLPAPHSRAPTGSCSPGRWGIAFSEGWTQAQRCQPGQPTWGLSFFLCPEGFTVLLLLPLLPLL